MNYKKLYFNIVDSINMNECNLKKLKLITKVKSKAFDRPMNLGDLMIARSKL